MTDFAPIKFMIEKFMIPFLSFSYEVITPNYGVAIILLTILIKILFYPIMNKQYQSMKKMQVLAPKMKEFREKYKTEPQKMHQETLKLYREHDINPFQGCLPMLLQIPFFIAIYATAMSPQFLALLAAPGANPGLSSFWLADLSLPDMTYILPVTLAIFTYYSQKMIMTDPQQKIILYLSPLLILFFGFKLPSGVLLYWATSTVLSTMQQVLVTRSSETSLAK